MQAMVTAVVAVEQVIVRSLEERAEDTRLLGRVEELELSRGIWEAQVEADVLKAQGKLQAANNSEARARTMEKHVERYLVEGDPEGEEGSPPVQREHVEPGEAEGVLPLHVGVEESPRQAALNYKFF